MIDLLKQIGESFSALIFPPLCLHCRARLEQIDHKLCPECLTLLEMINPKERCLFCFGVTERKICEVCSKKKEVVLNGVGAVFDYAGPAATLIRKLKYADQPYLAESLAGFIATQFFQMNWPFPDLIVPVPLPFTHWLVRGYNQSAMLAEGVSQILQIPMQTPLKRKSGDFSQAGLSKKQRLMLNGETFQLRKNPLIGDKCVLIIDDVMTTGSTLHKCAETLSEACPRAIYALTVCRSLQ